MTTWPFPDPENVAVFVDRAIFSGDWIALVTHDAEDGAWQFHTSSQVPLTISDAALISLRQIVDLDPTLVALADLPLGWRAWRGSVHGPWQRYAIN